MVADKRYWFNHPAFYTKLDYCSKDLTQFIQIAQTKSTYHQPIASLSTIASLADASLLFCK